MTIATRSFTGPVTLLRLPASTCSHRELLIGCSHVLPGPGVATARLFPRTGSCGHRSQRRAPPPCGYMPRHAVELARPTPCCPSCAPSEVFRVGRVYVHDLGRYGGVLSRVHVARLSISRPRPASVVPYNLPISRPDLLGLGPESLPWRQSSLTDPPKDTPAQSDRNGSSAATRAADRSRARRASTATSYAYYLVLDLLGLGRDSPLWPYTSVTFPTNRFRARDGWASSWQVKREADRPLARPARGQRRRR